MLYLEHVKAKKITVKLLKIKLHTFRKQLTVKQQDFASPCSINNFKHYICGITYAKRKWKVKYKMKLQKDMQIQEKKQTR